LSEYATAAQVMPDIGKIMKNTPPESKRGKKSGNDKV
jgi:hypothetical protein